MIWWICLLIYVVVQVLLESVYPSGVEFERQSSCDWLRFDREGELVVSAERTVPDWVHGREHFPPFLGNSCIELLDVCGARACQVATTQAATC